MILWAGMGFGHREHLRLLAALLLPCGTSLDLQSGMASAGPALAGGAGGTHLPSGGFVLMVAVLGLQRTLSMKLGCGPMGNVVLPGIEPIFCHHCRLSQEQVLPDPMANSAPWGPPLFDALP